MVRETRHLWVGNLPENIREDRIIDHFKRYGKVQSVRILQKSSSESNGLGPNCSINGTMLCNGLSATVAFIDIKSAAKAHSCENKIEERTLKTDYYEPHSYHHHDDHPPPSKSSHPPIVAPVSNVAAASASLAVSSSSSVSSTSAVAAASSITIAAASSTSSLAAQSSNVSVAAAAAVAASSATSANSSSAATASSSSVSAAAASSSSASSSSTSSTSPATSLPANASLFGRHTPSRISEERLYDSRDRSCSSSSHVEGSGYILKRNTISYHDDNDSQPYSSRSKSSREPPVSSRATFSNPTSTSNGNRNVSSSTGLNSFSDIESYCTNSNSVHESASNPTSSSSSHHHGTSSGSYQNLPGASSTQDNLSTSSSHSNDREDRQTTAICVRNFPIRSTDSNIKDGLYHEFKKYGRVAGVRVYGQSSERYAIVFFKKPEETERALSDSKDKQFFGIRIEVSPCDNLETEDNDFKPNETELDEYHPRATRTLFVGNLDKDISSNDLANKFGQFGEILEIDIKNQNQPYAFIQFTDISSVVKAMRKCDGETMGSTRLKLGFGKSFSTSCIWLCDTSDAFSDEKALLIQMKRYGMVKNHVFVRDQRSALIFYESSDDARKAVDDLRCKSVNGRKIQVDFASRDFQAYFLGKHAKPDDTHRGRSSGSVGSWIGNSNEYEDRIYDNSRARSISYHHQSTSRSASSVITSQHLRTNSNGGVASYSSRQRSPSPTSSPATLSTFGSFSRNSVTQSNSSSLHGSSRLSKYDYHHDSSSRLSSRQPYRYEVDDVDDIGEDSHLSSSSKRESSRYRHHLSENYLSELSPKVRRESSPYCSYPNSTTKLDQEFHRSSRLSATEELKPHDDVHGSLRRTSSNHSKSYHKSGRDSPPLPPTLSTQFRKSGLTSSSSSSSSSSRSPIRDLKSNSHYQDRNSPSPPTSPKANAYSYHDSDRLINDSSIIELGKVDKEYNTLNQWRRKSTEDSAYNRDFPSSDIQTRVRSESISDSCDNNFASLNPHRDYPRDRIREVHLNRTNSTSASPTSLTYQDSLKRKLDSDDASSDLSGHLERKKRLLACIEQSSSCSTNSQTLSAPITCATNIVGTNSATISVSNINKTINSSSEQQRITSSKSVDSAEVNGSKQQQTKLRDPRESSNLDFLIKRRSSSSSSSSSVANNSSHHSQSNSGGNCSNSTAPIIDLKAKNEVVHLFEQVLGEGVISNEQAVAVLSLLNNQNQDSKTTSNQLSRSKQLSTTSLGGQSINSSSKSKGLVKENSLGQHVRVIDVANSVVNSSIVDPRISSASYWKWTNRTSCDNDLSKLKSFDPNLSSVTSSSHSKSQNEYGPKSPMSLPLPEFALLVNRSTSSTDSKSNHSASSVVIANSSLSTVTTISTTTTTPNTTSLININIPTFSTSPKSTNIMSPLGNHSPVPKSRLSRDRMSADINSLDTKKLSTDLDDVSDSDVSPLRTTSFEAQIKALDEKYNAWSGTTSTVLPIKPEKTPTIDYSKYNIKKKSQVSSGSVSVNNISITNTPNESESSDIIKNLLSKSSVFDQDSKRLEHINEKYEPKDISSIDLESILSSPKSKTNPRIKLGSNNKDLPPSLTNSFQPSSITHSTPTEKLSLDSLPKTAPISTSVSSSIHNSASHHHNFNHHHPLTSSSSSSSNTISTSISSMTRKLSDPSRIYSIKKDSSIGPTSNLTPNTPNSAPVRSISNSMFPQFSRSSSIPITSTPITLTTTSSMSRNSFQHNSTLNNKKDNLFAVSCSVNMSNSKLEKSKSELTSPKPTLPLSVNANKDSIKKEKDQSTATKPDLGNKHNTTKPDYFKSKHSDSLEHNVIISSESEHVFKEQTKLKNDIPKYSKDFIKEEVKDSKKHDKDKERDKVEKLKIDRLNELNHHDSNQNSIVPSTPKEPKDKKLEKILSKEKKNKNKDKLKDVDYFNRDMNADKEHSSKELVRENSNVEKELTREKEHSNKPDKDSSREKEHSKDKESNRERNYSIKDIMREKDHYNKDKESNRDKDASSKESSRDKSHKESTREKSHLNEKEMNRVREHIKNTKSKLERRENKSEYKDKSKNFEKKNKYRDKKDRPMKQSEINELLKIAGCEPIYFSMYDKVKARSSANQSLKGSSVNENVRQKLCQLKDKRHRRDGDDGDDDGDDDDDEDDEDKNSSQDSESDSNSSFDEMIQNQKRFNLMKKRRAMIKSSDSSSDEEVNLKKPKKSISTDMIISDSDSDVPVSKLTDKDDERKKKASQLLSACTKRDIGFSSEESMDFSNLFNKPMKSSKFIKKFNEMITDDSSDNEEKIKAMKRKKKLKKDKDKLAELAHCSSKEKSESNDKVEKVKEHQKMKKSKADKKDKERDLDKPKCDKEKDKRIKSEDEDQVKISKFYKKKKKKTKSSKEKKHSKEEYKQQAEQNQRISKREVSSDQDNFSDSSDLDEIISNKKNLSALNNSDSDSENEMRTHMIKCYSKEKDAKSDSKPHKVDKEHHLKQSKDVKSSHVDKLEKTMQNAFNKADKEVKHEKGDKSPSKRNNIHSSFKKSIKDKTFIKIEEDSRILEIKEAKKKKKSSKYKDIKDNLRKDSDKDFDLKKLEMKEVSKTSSVEPKQTESDCGIYNRNYSNESPEMLTDYKILMAHESKDTLPSPPPKTPEISSSPSYTDEVLVNHEDGSSSDSRIDEELINNARRLEECMMANNEDSYGSNLSCSGSPLHSSSKTPHQTDLINLLPKSLMQVVPSNFSENSLDSKPIANLCPQQRSYEEEAAIQSLKLQKELETLDSKESDTISKSSFDPLPFTLFNSNTEKSVVEEHSFTNITPIVPKTKIAEIENLFACNEIESKIINEEQIKCTDFSSEIDSQRKIEDDLAVAALLQDMNDPCSHDEQSNHEQATTIDEPPSVHHADNFMNIIVSRTSDNDQEISTLHVDLSTPEQIDTPTSLPLTTISTDVTVADIVIDDQELKAAVQEIELSSDIPLVISKEVMLKPSSIIITPSSILAEDEIMFNDDDEEDIERELIVDESALDKSLQDDSEEVNDSDVVVRNFSEVSKPLVSTLDIQPFTFHSTTSEPIESDPFSLSKAKHMSMPILTATFETKKTMEPTTSVFSFETKPPILVDDVKELRLSVDSDKDSIFNNFLSPLSIATSETKKATPDIFSETISTDDKRDTCSESGVSDKTEIEEETISESFEDSLKLVCTELSKDEEVSLNDENINKINVEEYNDESDSNTKPKRSRRTKNRKYSDSSMHSPRSEHGSDSALSINTNLSGSGIALLSPNSLSPSTYPTATYSDVSPGSKRTKQQQQQLQPSSFGYAIRRSVRSAAVAATVANTTTALDELEENDFSLDDTSFNKDEHEDDTGLKKPSKRGRKKKNSGNSEGHKQPETETPKKDRTCLSLNVPSNDIHPKSSNSPYDVFEFRDSDEDEPIILDSIKSSGHFMASSLSEDKRHPEQLLESPPQTEISLSIKIEPQVQPAPSTLLIETSHELTNNPLNLPLSGKEYVSEVSQDGKLTIRLQSKDGQESIVNAIELTKPPKNLITEDSKSNDGLSNQSTCSTSSLQDTNTAAANAAKAVRKSARLMCQLPKTTIEDTIEDVIVKTAKKKEQETDKATGLKRVTRSVYRKSDDSSTQQQAQDSADDQEDSKNASLRNYRITRSRVSDSSEATESLSQSDNQIQSNNDSQATASAPTQKNLDDISDSTELTYQNTPVSNPVVNKMDLPIDPILPTIDEANIKVESNDEVTAIILTTETLKQSEPSPPSVIHSTGNVDKIPASVILADVSSVVTSVTSTPTLVPTSTPTLVPTSTSTSVITTYLQDIPNISERIHHSSTALKLKTGKGLFDNFIPTAQITETPNTISSPSVVLSSVSPAVISTPVTPKISDSYLSPVISTVSEASNQPVLTSITQSQSITIKPKYQPPVGKPLISSSAESWPSVPSTVSKSFVCTAQTTVAPTTSVPISSYSTPLSFALTDTAKHQEALIQPPPAHTPKPTVVIDSMKGLNMTTQSMPTSVVTSHQSPIIDPVTPVLSNSPKILQPKSSVVQITGTFQTAAHELSNLSYQQNATSLNTENFANHPKEFLNSFHKQQSATTNQPPQIGTPELPQQNSPMLPSNLSVLSHIRPQVSPASIGQPMMVPNQYVHPETLEALQQFMYMNALSMPPDLRNSQGIRAPIIPNRFIYSPGFGLPPGITPEAFVAAEAQRLQELSKEQPKNPDVGKQKQMPHAKPQKDEIQRQQQQIVDGLKNAGQEPVFHVDATQMPPPPCNQMLRNYPPFMMPERFNNDPSLIYGPNGQGRNVVIPNQSFGPSPTDLTKQIPPQSLTPEPMKRSPMHRQLSSPHAHSPAYRKELPPVVEPTTDMICSQITGQFPKDLVSHSPLPINMTSHLSQRPPSRPPSAIHQIQPACTDQSIPLVRRTSSANLVTEPSMINSPPLINSTLNPPLIEQPLQNPQKPQLGTSQDEMLCKYPVLLRGLLALKNDQASIQMHYVSGNVHIANRALYSFKENETLPIRITQRMRIDQAQLQGLERKIQSKDEHCILLVLPCGRDEGEVVQQSANLNKYFITYLQSKLAAGIVNTNDDTCSYITHIFPTCDFSEEHLVRVAPDLLQTSQGFSHLMVVITN